MAGKISSQMLQLHQQFVDSSSGRGAKISEQQAKQLIDKAQEMNQHSHQSSCFSSGEKGDRHLSRLFDKYENSFSKQSQKMINEYLQHGRIPVGGGSGSSSSGGGVDFHPPSGPGSSSTHGSHGSHGSSGSSSTHGSHSNHGSSGSSSTHGSHGSHGSSGSSSSSTHGSHGSHGSSGSSSTHGSHGSHGSSGSSSTHGSHGSHGSSGSTSTHGNTGGSSTPTTTGGSSTSGSSSNDTVISGGSSSNSGNDGVSTSPGSGSGSIISEPSDPVGGNNNVNVDTDDGTSSVHGTKIIGMVASKKTWHCHWFPMQETRAGGDPTNNLYADGGCLNKLDMITGGKAQAYEKSHNRKAVDAGKKYAWWGHCNNASEAACILRAPKHDVKIKGANGQDVHFTRNDIQGLLVKVTPSLTANVNFRGDRYNGPSDDPSDPAPHVFLDVLQSWSKDGIPFVLDIDRKQQVWNYPYDQVAVYESDKAPSGYNAPAMSGDVKFYHMELKGSGFAEQERTYKAYIQRDSSGKVISSGWIKTPNTNNNPDFMWRPHPVGDLTDRSNWVLRGRPSNPEVDPQVVYDIYMKSLA